MFASQKWVAQSPKAKQVLGFIKLLVLAPVVGLIILGLNYLSAGVYGHGVVSWIINTMVVLAVLVGWTKYQMNIRNREHGRIMRSMTLERRRMRIEAAFLRYLAAGETFSEEEQVWKTPTPPDNSAIVTNTISALLQRTDQCAQSLGNELTAQSVLKVSHESLSLVVRPGIGDELEQRLVNVTCHLPEGKKLKLWFPLLKVEFTLGGVV